MEITICLTLSRPDDLANVYHKRCAHDQSPSGVDLCENAGLGPETPEAGSPEMGDDFRPGPSGTGTSVYLLRRVGVELPSERSLPSCSGVDFMNLNFCRKVYGLIFNIKFYVRTKCSG
jgi:hypothetical protein